MSSKKAIFILPLLVSHLVVSFDTTLLLAGSQWLEIPLKAADGTEYTLVRSFALGPDGTPWAFFEDPRKELCYFDGTHWRAASPPLKITGYVGFFRIGSRGDLWCEFRRPLSNRQPDEGRLLKIVGKVVTEVAEFSYEETYRPALYFDRSGRIWNWTSTCLAKYESGEWKRWEADFGSVRRSFGPSVIEVDSDHIYFIAFEGTDALIHYFCEGVFGRKTFPLPTVPISPEDKRDDDEYKRVTAMWPRAFPWPDGKTVIVRKSAQYLACLDLETLECEEPPFQADLQGRFRPRAVFQDSDKSLLMFGRRKGTPGASHNDCVCMKLDASTGKLSDVPEMSGIIWQWMNSVQNPNCLCFGNDGSIFIGTERQGVVRVTDGMAEFSDWQDGVRQIGISHVYEAPDRKVWCASHSAVLVYDPKRPPIARDREWEGKEIANYSFLRDNDFNLWMFLRDRPGSVSRFDGTNWRHFDLGTDPRTYLNLFVDNANRVYVASYGDERAWRIDPDDGVKPYENMWQMLVSAVANGASCFRSSRNLVGPLVTEEGQIFIGFRSCRALHNYDGEQWREMPFEPDGIEHLFPWKDGSVIVRNTAQSFYRLDKGRFPRFSNPRGLCGELLIGESGLELLDRTRFQTSSEGEFPVWIRGRNTIIYDNLERLDSSPTKGPYPGAVEIDTWAPYFRAIRLSPFGGYWAISGPANVENEVVRSWDGLHLRFSTRDTPVQNCSVRDIYEDPAGKLWLYFGWPSCTDLIYVVHRPEMETRIKDEIEGVVKQREVNVEFFGTQDGRRVDDIRFAWRLNGGDWSTPRDEKRATIRIPKSGEYLFEVVAIGKYTAIDTTPAQMSFMADVKSPAAVIVSQIPDTVRGPVLPIELDVEGVTEADEITYKWRINNGFWHETEEKKLFLDNLRDGRYFFEVRVIAKGKYEQTGSTRVEFEVKVDDARFVEQQIELLHSKDLADREKAVMNCVALGEACLAPLEAALAGASPDVAWWIKAAIGEIKRKGGNRP